MSTVDNTNIHPEQWDGDANNGNLDTDDFRANIQEIKDQFGNAASDIGSVESDITALQGTVGDITEAEADQIENIGSTTISPASWGFVGGMDQGVAMADSVTFATIDTGNGPQEVDAAAGKGVTGADANAVTGTAGTDGNLSQWNIDGDLVDGPSFTPSNTANAVAQRDANGRAKFADPSADQDAATKVYVDAGPMVWEATKTDPATTTSDSWVDVPDLSITLTPATTDDDFAVEFHATGSADTDSSTDGIPLFRLVRDSTALLVGDAAGSREQTQVVGYFDNTRNTGASSPSSGKAIDSPATTDPVTYKLQWMRNGGGGTAQLNRTANDADNDSNPRSASSLHVTRVRLQT